MSSELTSSSVLDRPAAAPPPAARWRRPLLAFHVAVAGAAIGAELVLLVLATSGVLGAEPAQVYPAMSVIGRWVLAPAAVAILVSGIALARRGKYGLTRYWWVTIKLAIATTLTTLAGLVLVPALGRAADAAAELDAGSALPDGQPLALLIPTLVALPLLLLSLGLGVFKPRWRLRRRSG